MHVVSAAAAHELLHTRRYGAEMPELFKNTQDLKTREWKDPSVSQVLNYCLWQFFYSSSILKTHVLFLTTYVWLFLRKMMDVHSLTREHCFMGGILCADLKFENIHFPQRLCDF